MKYECDCGARYGNLDAMMACANANHGNPRPPRRAASFTTGEAESGNIEFQMLDEAGEPFARVELRPDDLPEFVSQIVSIGGADELGRDIALMLYKVWPSALAGEKDK